MCVKKSKNRCGVIWLTLLLLVLCAGCGKDELPVETGFTGGSDQVDLALFWGQSNMVGYAGFYPEEKVSAHILPDQTGLDGIIDKDILEAYDAVGHVAVEIPKEVAYEYAYLQDQLVELTPSTVRVGEFLTYEPEKADMHEYDSGSDGYYSLLASYGTNMIPAFCARYYEQTGRRLVVVFAANGGEPIGNFLPCTEEASKEEVEQYIYEAMKLKYQSAAACMEANGMEVGNRFYVVFQGESDTTEALCGNYAQTFAKMHRLLIRKDGDFDLDFGVLVKTSRRISDQQYETIASYVEQVHDAQIQLTTCSDEQLWELAGREEDAGDFPGKTDTLIAGSDLGYRVYRQRVENCFCSPAVRQSDGTWKDNSYHYTSAALCQIGRETADAVAKRLKENTSCHAS